MDLKKILETISKALKLIASPFKSAESKHGVKELSEGLHGANALSLYMVGALKDGLQMEDITGLMAKWQEDEEFKKKLMDAAEGASKIPEEVKDIDASEGMELAALQIEYVDDYIEAVKK